MPWRRHHPCRVGGEHVALAAGVVADDDTALGGPRVGVEQVLRQPGCRLAHHETVHPQRTGADGGPQPGRAELQPTVEPRRELVGVAVDQRLRARRGCRRRVRRPASARRGSTSGSRSSHQGTQLDQRAGTDVRDDLGRGDRSEPTALGAAAGPLVSPYRNPAAYRSPAPVVSITRRTGTAGTAIRSSPVMITNPSAPTVIAANSQCRRSSATAVVERLGLVQRDQFVLVAEQQVDLVGDERHGSRRGDGRRRTSRTASATPCRPRAWATPAACRNAALASSRSNR